MNGKEDLIVTIEQFWLSEYWRALNPKNLTFFYEFIVKVNIFLCLVAKFNFF